MIFNPKNRKFFFLFLIIYRTHLMFGFRFEERKGYIEEGELSIKVLEKALSYLKQNPKSIVEDVVLGVLLANANLAWINNRLRLLQEDRYLWRKHVNMLMRRCNDVISVSNNQNDSILNTELWSDGAEDLKAGHLQPNRQHLSLPNFYSCQDIDNYMMNGSPTNSNYCVRELVTNKCNVSNHCWFSEFNNQTHSGYKTTHRLLYFQIAKKVGCEKENRIKFSGIENHKKSLCEKMLKEARALYESRYFLLTRDLFMEEIGLCGFEGYEEFAPASWREQIRNWQGESGCFGEDMNFDNCSEDFARINKPRTKRTDLTINKCHTHVTAVAISAVAFHLRVILSRLLVL